MANQSRPPPTFIFRIDEIYERADAPHNIDNRGRWLPLAVAGWNQRKGANHGVSYRWWWFNGDTIQPLIRNELPENASHYKTFSMYYCEALGLYVLHGDATSPARHAVWHPIMFDHKADYSSVVAQTGSEHTLRCHDPNIRWPQMLLPSIYYGPEYTPYPGRGGFTGELPIFLALIALSMKPHRLLHVLPYMFQGGQWATHMETPGRDHQRGVIVSVYAYGGNHGELEKYEEGDYGKFYYG